jgi:hypothetical protein
MTLRLPEGLEARLAQIEHELAELRSCPMACPGRACPTACPRPIASDPKD